MKTDIIDIKERLREIFENTVESDFRYEGNYNIVDYYSVLVKAGSKDSLFKILDNNMCMMNYTYENSDAVIMFFAVAINPEGTGVKHLSERVIDIVYELERCFVTLNFVKAEEVKEDKFMYITVIKKLEEYE